MGTETRLPFLTEPRQESVARHKIPFNVLNSFDLKSSLSLSLKLMKTPTKPKFSRKTHIFESALQSEDIENVSVDDPGGR